MSCPPLESTMKMPGSATARVARAAAFVIASVTVSLAAQSDSGRKPFDIRRLADSEGQFQTFHVTDTRPLRKAMDAGIVRENTSLLVTETAGGKLALITDQMAFHHIAQGTAAGKEWMADF